MSQHSIDVSGGAAKGAWQVTTGAVFISLAAPLVKAMAVDPTIAAVFRVLFGAMALGAILLMQPRWRENWRSGWGSSALIAFCFTLDLWFWHRSIHWLGPGLATLLANFQVFLLPLAARWLYGEKPQPVFYFGLVLAALGLWLLFGLSWQDFSTVNRWGILYALLTAAAYAAYILTLRHFQSAPRAPGAAVRLFQVCIWCTLMLAATTWDLREQYTNIAGADWLRLIALGVLCQVLGWLFITRGLPQVAAAVAGLLLLLQPSLSLTWDHFFFDLALNGWQLSGVFLTLVGIYSGSVVRRRRSA